MDLPDPPQCAVLISNPVLITIDPLVFAAWDKGKPRQIVCLSTISFVDP